MGQFKYWKLWLVATIFIVLASSTKREEFHEELFIRTLNDRHVLFQFQFTSLLRFTDMYSDDYTVFPRNIGKIVKSFELEEFHLALTQGRWLTEKWGAYPLISSPVGAELSARFSHKALDTNWERLTQTLAGIFCGSLDELSGKVATLTCFPQLSTPRGTLSTNSSKTFYGILPRENVCTENLTPWSKLLPCVTQAGIASLLNAIELYSAPFHSLGSHVQVIQNGSESILQYVQTVASVIELPNNKNSWSFQDAFGKQQISACSLASVSKIHFLNSPALSWNIPSGFPVAEVDGSKTVDLNSQGFSMTATWNSNPIVSQANLCFAKRFLRTEGHEFGGIKAIISNENNIPATVSYLEILPWYLRTWFHSLKLKMNGTEISMEDSNTVKAFEMIPSHFYDSQDLKFRYPNQLELVVEIPAFSTLVLEFQFDKGFLHFTAHPPDAHRGFDIGSALITCDYSKHSSNSQQNSSLQGRYFNQQNWIQIYTDPLLVVLPTPDFSMPYNVLTLTGTVFALCFGSVYNLLIRRMKDLERVNGEYVSNRPLARILRKLQQLIQ